MAKKKNEKIDFKNEFEDIPGQEQNQAKKVKYTYAPWDRRASAAFTVREEYLDKISRLAYHNQKSKSEIVDILLSRQLEGLEVPPIPEVPENIRM